MKNFRSLPEELSNSLSVSALSGMTLLFFTPAMIYYLNGSQFLFSFPDVAVYLVFLAALFAAAGVAVIFLLPSRLRGLTIAAGAGLAAAMWLQANVIVWDYGVLDGRPVQWARHDAKTFLELAVWACLIGLAACFRAFVLRHLKPFCFFLLLVQAVSLGVTVARAPRYDIKRWAIDEREKFAFSSTRNVIILVLDSFQSTHFLEALGGDQGAAGLDGFIYFRNAVSGYNRTYPSVPSILTGRYYDNSARIQDFVKEAYHSEGSLPKAIRVEGGVVHLFPDSLTRIYPDPAIISNLVRKVPGGWKYRHDAMNLAALGFFRGSPHAVKKLVFHSLHRHQGTWWTPQLMSSEKYVRSDLAFFNQFEERGRVELDATVLKYYHLNGVHWPFYMTRDMKLERRMPQNTQGYREQAAGCMALVPRMLNTLKKLGIYDRSMILVLGDHGAAIPFRVPPDVPGAAEPQTKRVTNKWLDSRGEALPLVLVKPFNSRGPLRRSDTPVCLSDVPLTVASELGLKGRFSGYPMQGAIPPGRERRFLHYTWKRLEFDEPYLPTMNEWSVSGHAWLEGAWKTTGRVFDRPKPKKAQ